MEQSLAGHYQKVWKQVFSDKKYRNTFLITFLLFALIMILFTRFLVFVENREGVVFTDPFLIYHNAIDLSWVTFSLIYIAVITALIYLTRHPRQFIIALQAYGIMVLIRTIAMYSIPLEPPLDFIPLKDPFVGLFREGNILVNDLFFSGHTATMFILFLTAVNKKVKLIFLTALIVVSSGVLLQKVHYTVDVLSAPFFCYAAYRIAIYITERLRLPKETER